MDDIVTGITTGFEKLDYMTAGLQRGNLIVVAAKSGLGKTSFCLNIAINAAMNYELPVGIFTLEMTKEQLMLRMLSIQAKVPQLHLKNGYISDDELRRIYKAKNDLSQAKIYINDSYAITTSELCREAVRQKTEKGLELIIVDYLQLISSNTSYTTRGLEIEEIYSSLKVLAEELNIPVIVVSQLNRHTEEYKHKRPPSPDHSDNSYMQKYADIVLIINKEELDSMYSNGIAEITISKQNRGTIGRINLAYLDLIGVPTFIDLVEEYEEDFA